MIAALFLALASSLPSQDGLDPALIVDHPALESGDFARLREDLLAGLERDPASPWAALAVAQLGELGEVCAEPLDGERLLALSGSVREGLASLRLRRLVQEEERRARFSDHPLERAGDLWGDFVREWRVIGPLGPLDRPAPLRLPLAGAPEEGPRPTHRSAAGVELAWRPLLRPPNALLVLPGEELSYGGAGLGYLLAYLRCEPGEHLLEVLCTDAAQVFWNGRLVLEELVRGLGEDEDRFVAPVTAQAGWNTLLLRFENGDLGLAARLLDGAGRPVACAELPAASAELFAPAPSPARPARAEAGRGVGLERVAWMLDALARGRVDLALSETRPTNPALVRPWLRVRHAALTRARHLPGEVQRRALLEVEEEMQRGGGLPPLARATQALRWTEEDRPAEALASAEALVAELPDVPAAHAARLAALRALDEAGELERAAQLELDARFPARAEGAFGLGVRCARSGDLAGALAYLRRALERAGNDARVLNEAIPLLARAGGEPLRFVRERLADWCAAEPGNERPRALLRMAAGIAGDDAALEALLREARAEHPARIERALELADFLLARGRSGEAGALYREVLQRRPGAHGARAALALLGVEDPAERFFAAYAPDRDEAFAAREAARDASVAELLDSGMTYLYPDGSSRQRMHTISLALDRKGTEQLHEQPVAEHSRLARVLEPDGGVLEPVEVSGAWVMPSLDVGDAVELVWEDFGTGLPGVPPSLGWWRFASFEKPFVRSRYAIYVPDGLPGELRAFQFDGEHREERFEGGTVHVFLARDQPRQKEERFQPSYEEILPWLQFGADRSLDEVEAGLRERFDVLEHVPADVGSELDELVATLPGGLDPLERARELYARVTERVLDFEGPALAAGAWTARRGDPIFLLGALFRRAGVPFHWCALEKGVAPELDPAPAHAFEPPGNYAGVVLWIDVEPPVCLIGGSGRGARFGALPAELAGARVLALTEGGHELAELPRSQLDELWDVDLAVSYSLTADGAALTTGTLRVTTAGGAVLRERVSQSGDVQRRAFARGMLGQLVPGLDLTDFDFPGLADRGGDFQLAFEGTIPGFVRAAGTETVADLRLPPRPLSTLLGPAQRVWPVALRQSNRERARVRLAGGPAWRILGGPAPFHVERAGFRHELEVRSAEEAWEWRRELVVRGLELSVDELGAFLQGAGEREREESRAVRLERR